MRPADHVLSGLPFVSLPAPVTRGILDAVTATLKPGGTFTTFQYVHAFGWPSATAFRRAMSERMAGPPQSRLVMRNVPPAFALTWTKG
jgi:phospholipid N-methyltransferase